MNTTLTMVLTMTVSLPTWPFELHNRLIEQDEEEEDEGEEDEVYYDQGHHREFSCPSGANMPILT